MLSLNVTMVLELSEVEKQRTIKERLDMMQAIQDCKDNSINSALNIPDKTFYTYELDGKKIAFHKDALISIEMGYRNSSYEVMRTFTAMEFGRAIMVYNAYNIHSGYKKRLVCSSLNKPILARYISKWNYYLKTWVRKLRTKQ